MRPPQKSRRLRRYDHRNKTVKHDLQASASSPPPLPPVVKSKQRTPSKIPRPTASPPRTRKDSEETMATLSTKSSSTDRRRRDHHQDDRASEKTRELHLRQTPSAEHEREEEKKRASITRSRERAVRRVRHSRASSASPYKSRLPDPQGFCPPRTAHKERDHHTNQRRDPDQDECQTQASKSNVVTLQHSLPNSYSEESQTRDSNSGSAVITLQHNLPTNPPRNRDQAREDEDDNDRQTMVSELTVNSTTFRDRLYARARNKQQGGNKCRPARQQVSLPPRASSPVCLLQEENDDDEYDDLRSLDDSLTQESAILDAILNENDDEEDDFVVNTIPSAPSRYDDSPRDFPEGSGDHHRHNRSRERSRQYSSEEDADDDILSTESIPRHRRRHHREKEDRERDRFRTPTLNGVSSLLDDEDRPSQILDRLEGVIRDDEDCILSVELESNANESNLEISRSYIISEPQGTLVDELIDGSKGNQSQIQRGQSCSASGKVSIQGSHGSKSTKKDDGLACGFSVEPLSPFSEVSSSHNRRTNGRRGILAMFEQYLPEDRSDGPINAVFDPYLPTFTSSGEASTVDQDLESTDRASASTTSHPLRFVNELALASSSEGAKQSCSTNKHAATKRSAKSSRLIKINRQVSGSTQSSKTRKGQSGLRHQDSCSTNPSSEEGLVLQQQDTCSTPEQSESTLPGGKDALKPLNTFSVKWGNSQKLSLEESFSESLEKSGTFLDEGMALEEEGFEVTEQGTIAGEEESNLDVGVVEDERVESLRKEGNNLDAGIKDEAVEGLQKPHTNTSIQMNSPKWRGWKPEELEVILTTSSSPSSFARDLETLQREKAEQIQARASKSPNSCGAESDVSSTFSIPHITATLTYDSCSSEDPIPIPPTTAITEEQSICESESQGQNENYVGPKNKYSSTPLAVNIKKAQMFNFNSPPSSQRRTPTTRKHANMKLHTPNTSNKGLLPIRHRSHSSFGDRLLIRSTRSEDLPFNHQPKTFWDKIDEQIDATPPDVPNHDTVCESTNDKENKPFALSDSWQSSLDSLKQLKGTQCSQRGLLTRLIAERNGANVTASTAKSKLKDCSEKYRTALASRDYEIEGLQRANRLLRVQVAQVRATKFEPDTLSRNHGEVTQLTRKLQDLNANGVAVERAEMEVEANAKSPSRLYRSERTRSSEFLEIDNCMFELKTTEVTTLQVNDPQDVQGENEQHDATSNADHEIQVAISRIVAKETAFLRQKVDSLELELEQEKVNSLVAYSQSSGSGASQKISLRSAAIEGRGVTGREPENQSRDAASTPASRDDAEANGDQSDESKQLVVLSRRLEDAQKEANKASKLKKELEESRLACEEYRDKWSKAELEVTNAEKASSKAMEQLESSLKYYKQKAQSLEEVHGSLKDVASAVQVDPSKDEIAVLRQQVDILQNDYAEVEQGRVEAVAKCKAMDAELQQTKLDLQSRILDNDNLLKKTEQLFAAKSKCDEKILQLEAKQVTNQNEECQPSQEKDVFLQHYKRSVTKLEKEIAAMREAEKRSSDSTRDEISSLRELVEKVRQDYEGAKRGRDEATEKCRDITVKHERLKHELQDSKLENQEIVNKADQMKEAREACERKVALLESETAQLKLEAEKQSLQNHGSIEVFKVRVLNLERELSASKERELQALEKSEKQLGMLRDEASQLQEKTDLLKQERDFLTSNSKEATSELSKVKHDLEQTNSDKERLFSEVQHLQVTKEDYEGRLTTLRAELHAACEEKQRYLDEKNECIEQSKQQVSKLENDLEAIKLRETSSADDAKELISSYEARISRLQTDLSTVREAVERSKQGISSKEGRIETLQKDLEREKEESRKAAAAKEERISDLLKDLQMAKRDVNFKEERIASLREDLEREAEEARRAIASKEDRISDLRQQLFQAESERDAITLTCDSVSVDLERTKRDLESRILDNTELSLRVDQLFAAKEECEEKIAAMEEAGATNHHEGQGSTHPPERRWSLSSLWSQAPIPVASLDQEEALMFAKMRISTLESEVEELRELTKSQEEEDEISACTLSTDVYSLNREKKEALAECAFMVKENKKISAMLESTREDLGQSLIEISRLEMDLEEASLATEGRLPNNVPETCDDTIRSDINVKFLTDQNDVLSKKLELSLSENATLKNDVKRLENNQTNQVKQVGQELQTKYKSETQALLKKVAFLEQRFQEKETSTILLAREKAGLLEKVGSLEKTALERVEGGKSSITQLTRDKQDLLEKVVALEKAAQERAAEDTSSTSEKRALMAEIRRLEKVQESSHSTISKQQASLEAAMNEVSHLKGALIQKEAKERSSSEEAAQIQSRTSDMEAKVKVAEALCAKAAEQCNSKEKELERKLRSLEGRASSAEKEATHFKIQISEMEQKLFTAEDSFDEAMKKYKSEQLRREKQSFQVERAEAQLELKKKDMDDLSKELQNLREQHKASLKAKQEEIENLRKQHEASLKATQKELEARGHKKKNESKNLKSLTAALVIAQENEAELIRTMHVAQERDRAELLLLREQVATLQNHISASEEKRKKIEMENETLLSKHEQASSKLHEKELEIKLLLESSEEGHTSVEMQQVPYDQKTRKPRGNNYHAEHATENRGPRAGGDTLDRDGTWTLNALESNKSRMNKLDERLQKTVTEQAKYVETIDSLKQELSALHRNRKADECDTEMAKAKENAQHLSTLLVLQKNKSRMHELEEHLQQSLENQTRDVEQISLLKQELTSLQSRGLVAGDEIETFCNSRSTEPTDKQGAFQDDKITREIEDLRQEILVLKNDKEAKGARNNAKSQERKNSDRPPRPKPCESVQVRAEVPISDNQSDVESDCGLNTLISDMSSINSKVAMSISSRSMALPDVVQKHTSYAQKLNKQLGSAQEREDEVARNVARKLSLLEKQVSKMKNSNTDASNGSVPSADDETLEFDLECRLADVAQLATMFELVIVDKKKSEDKMKALYKTNADYMTEVKSIISEKDDVLNRQGSVIETLSKELAVLQEREKVNSLNLFSEISLLEENLSHLSAQYDQDDTVQEQAENRLEIAVRERQSLGVALKQVRSEREYCQMRMPNLSREISSLQAEMEARIAKLKNSQSCPKDIDWHLYQSATKLKQTVEDILSYANSNQRKQLRIQTIKSSSSDTGEPEYFVTLNDYDYQLYKESAAMSSKEHKKAMKAAAASKQRFVC